MMTARVFKSGNSQAVRLPKKFRVNTGTVQIFRRGDEIVLRERPLKLSELLARLTPFADDFPENIPDAPPQERDWAAWFDEPRASAKAPARLKRRRAAAGGLRRGTRR